MNAAWFPAEALLRGLADHLWQSTWVALGAAALAWAFRRYRARIRAAIWLVASLKFLVPFAALVALGRLAPWPELRAVAPAGAVAAVEAAGQPFSPLRWDASARPPSTDAIPRPTGVVPVVFGAWAAGSVCLLLIVAIRAGRSRRLLRDSDPLPGGRERAALARVRGGRSRGAIEMRSTDALLSPCVVGIRRPTLCWPRGLSDRLSNAELDAIVSHELCHVDRRDNLAATVQTAVQILFWFHPVVWWIGARWNDERERACDQHVLARNAPPELYAEGILKVGEFCVGRSAMEHAGITGSRLTERIEAIMTEQTPRELGWRGRAAIASATAFVVCAPVLIGASRFGGETPAPAEAATTLAARAAAPAALVEPPAPPPQQTAATRAASTASIGGTVIDPTGAWIPGAPVVIARAGEVATAYTAVTDSDGRFGVGDIPAGDYDLRVQVPGFRTVTRRVRAGDAASTSLKLELQIGSLTESVTLRAAPGEAPAAPVVAEGEWQERLNGDPGNPKLFFDLARLYYQQERFVESDAMVSRGTDLLARGVSTEPLAGTMTGQRGGEIKEPRKIRDVKPIYPRVALTSRTAGVVILEATIGRDGAVRNPKILRSVASLDQAAIGAVRQWLFTPTLLNGRPIDVYMTVTVTFELQGDGGAER